VDESTKTNQDSSPAGDKAPEQSVTTPGETKTYTFEEYSKLSKEKKATDGRVKTLNADLAKTQSERDEIKAELQETNSRIEELENNMREQRLASYRDDPEKLKHALAEDDVAVRAKDIDKRERTLKARQKEIEAREQYLNETTVKNLCSTLAAKYGADVNELLELGISDPEKLEKYAKRLGSSTKKPEEENKEDEFTPDRNTSSGAFGQPTVSQMEKWTPEQFAEWLKKKRK
jgi:chromosome segregation ATPase